MTNHLAYSICSVLVRETSVSSDQLAASKRYIIQLVHTLLRAGFVSLRTIVAPLLICTNMQTGKAAGLRNQCLKVRLLLCAPSPDKDFKYLSLAYGGRLKVSNILHNKCASGGIGRRTGLKILGVNNSCGFESHLAHQ